MNTTNLDNIKEIKVVGFIQINEEGDTYIEYFSDANFSEIMLSLERIDEVRFVLHMPKKNILKVYLTRPFKFVRNKLDEIFDYIFKTKPKYYESVE